MTQARLLEKLAAELERWNREHPTGCQVQVHLPGRIFQGGPRHTTSAAFLHNRHQVVFVSDLSVAIPLEWCVPC